MLSRGLSKISSLPVRKLAHGRSLYLRMLTRSIVAIVSLLVLWIFPNHHVASSNSVCDEWYDVNVHFVIDYSNSMNGWKAILARDFALGVLDNLNAVGHLQRAGLVPFPADWSFPPTTDISRVRNAILNLPSNGAGTPLYDAIVIGASQLEELPSSGRKILIVITDGADYDSHFRYEDARDVLNSVTSWNYLVFAGNPSDLGASILSNLAAETGSAFGQASSSADLQSLITEVTKNACRNYRPEAAMTLSHSTLKLGVDGFSIFFDGSPSSDVETSDLSLTFTWTFARPDGTTFTRTGLSFREEFNDSQLPHGEVWTVHLRVTDPSGASDATTQSFRVVGSPPDIKVSGTTDIRALKDISLQVDPPLNDIDGGGSYHIVWNIVKSPPNASHGPTSCFTKDSSLDSSLSCTTEENDIGTWVFRATATDNEGDEDRAEITVIVNNLFPEIHIEGDTQIDVGDEIFLQATEWVDPDGGLIEFEWDIIQAPQSASLSVQENFVGGTGESGATLRIGTEANSAGTWIFALTATDNERESVSVEHTILVDGPAIADISGPSSVGLLDFPLTLDGNGSLDPDSPCPNTVNYCHDTLDGRRAIVSSGLSYSWSLIEVPTDLWDDYAPGRVDEVFGINAYGKTINLGIEDLEPGNWTFRLDVADAEENRDFTTFTVEVLDENGPPIVWLSPPRRYTTDISGNLDQDIIVSGVLSYDPDNILPGSPPLPGITDYNWEIDSSPESCMDTPSLPSGPDQHTVTLYSGSVPPACHGTWQIGLTVTDDDSNPHTASGNTTAIIGNCVGTICIDYPTALNPQYVEFAENTDITIYYHMDSALYDDPLFMYGIYAKLEVFHESDLAIPVFSAVDPNPLPTGFLAFHWNGYSNALLRPQSGLYTIKISLINPSFEATAFEVVESAAIWLAVTRPQIAATSDKYVGLADLSSGVDQIDLEYEISGATTADELRWQIYDATNSLVFEQTKPFATSGSFIWNGRPGNATDVVPPGQYNIVLEVLQAGVSLGVPGSHSVFVIDVDLAVDLDRDGSYVDDDTDENTPPGMLIFINNDDDNQNGIEDLIDSDGAFENDLLDLTVLGMPGALDAGKIVLEVLQGADRIKVWTSPEKGQENLILDSTSGIKQWIIGVDIASFDAFPDVLYIEAVGKRNDVGDAVLELRYELSGSILGFDEITITILSDEDIILYEAAAPENTAVSYGSVAGDERTLLFFHDCPTPGNELNGTSTLKLAIQSSPRLMYRYDVLEPSYSPNVATGRFGSTPVNTTLTYVDDRNGDRDPDMALLVGIDLDQDGVLEDEEVRTRFHLHLVTADNYEDSLDEIINVVLPLGLNDMSDALFRRFATGSFDGSDPDYIPDTGTERMIVGGNENRSLRPNFTHNFGAEFNSVGKTAFAAVPVISYTLGSPGSDLFSSTNDPTGGYRSGIVEFMETSREFTYTNILAGYQAAGGGPVGTSHVVTFTDLRVPMDMGILEIGTGHITATGNIVTSIIRTDVDEYTLENVRSLLTIEDLFDFNFFKDSLIAAGILGQSQNGASIQAGFGRCNNTLGVGESFVTRVVTDQTFDGFLPLLPTASISVVKTPGTGAVTSSINIVSPPNNPEPLDADFSTNFSFLSTSTVSAQAVLNPPGDEAEIVWEVVALNALSNEVSNIQPANMRGPSISFQPNPLPPPPYVKGTRCNNPGNGSCDRSQPLSYLIRATYHGQSDEVTITQDQIDIVRQEYLHHAIDVPDRAAFSLPSRTTNFSVNEIVGPNAYSIVLGTPGILAQAVRDNYNALIYDDIQEVPMGTDGLTNDQIIVSPGSAIQEIGPILETQPCAGAPNPETCDDAILDNHIIAGENGIAETMANNQPADYGLSLNSAWRNPERNEAVGGVLNSRHQYGNAVDLFPLGPATYSKTQRFCILQTAADAVGGADGFAEGRPNDGAVIEKLDCDVETESETATLTHVHVQQ